MMLPAARRVPVDWRILLPQFLRFGVVGTIGFGVYTGTLYATVWLIGIYVAGIVSYLIAATGNWLINRLWTFKGHGHGPMLRQWLMFLAANSLGMVLNLGCLFLLDHFSPLVHAHKIIGTAAGTLIGLFANFALSHRMVFRAHEDGAHE
jgi:putative flippase GtrA